MNKRITDCRSGLVHSGLDKMQFKFLARCLISLLRGRVGLGSRHVHDWSLNVKAEFLFAAESWTGVQGRRGTERFRSQGEKEILSYPFLIVRQTSPVVVFVYFLFFELWRFEIVCYFWDFSLSFCEVLFDCTVLYQSFAFKMFWRFVLWIFVTIYFRFTEWQSCQFIIEWSWYHRISKINYHPLSKSTTNILMFTVITHEFWLKIQNRDIRKNTYLYVVCRQRFVQTFDEFVVNSGIREMSSKYYRLWIKIRDVSTIGISERNSTCVGRFEKTTFSSTKLHGSWCPLLRLKNRWEQIWFSLKVKFLNTSVISWWFVRRTEKSTRRTLCIFLLETTDVLDVGWIILWHVILWRSSNYVFDSFERK